MMVSIFVTEKFDIKNKHLVTSPYSIATFAGTLSLANVGHMAAFSNILSVETCTVPALASLMLSQL